jgi:hypothetical protein
VAIKHGREILPTELPVNEGGEVLKFVIFPKSANSGLVICFNMDLKCLSCGRKCSWDHDGFECDLVSWVNWAVARPFFVIEEDHRGSGIKA